MAQNDIIELSVVADVGVVSTAVVMHMQQTTSNPVGDPSGDVLQAFLNSNIPTLWQVRSSNQAILSCVKAQVIAPVRGVANFQSTSLTGNVNADSLSPALGVQHSWQGDGFTRNQTGWHTWSGIPVTHQFQNNLNAVGRVEELAFANRFLSVITEDGDYDFGVWSPKLGTFANLAFVGVRQVLRTIRTRRAVQCV